MLHDLPLITLSLSPGVTVQCGAPGRLSLYTRRGSTDLEGPAALVDLIEALGSNGGRPFKQLEDHIADSGGIGGLAQWSVLLNRLHGEAAAAYALSGPDGVVARLIPGRAGFALDGEGPTCRVMLSRFAFVRRDGDRLVLDSPMAPGPIELVDAATMRVVAALGTPHAVAQLASEVREAWVPLFTSLLHSVGLLTEVAEDGTSPEERERDVALWEFQDLLLHSSYRTTRRDRLVGATYRWRGTFDPLPALPPALTAERIPLARLGNLAAMPLSEALEQRRSIRTHDGPPLGGEQLGAFLWHVAGVRSNGDESLGDAPYEIAPRVYPSGGACYPLEIYPVIGRCADIAPGVYRYDPQGHALEMVSSDMRETQDLLSSFAWVMQDDAVPDVLFVITARFGRVAWKYEGIAYATILKEVGVLYEAMYLVATAMHLAPCAAGAGSTATFERIAGLDPLHEAPVGEFVLGSRA